MFCCQSFASVNWCAEWIFINAFKVFVSRDCTKMNYLETSFQLYSLSNNFDDKSSSAWLCAEAFSFISVSRLSVPFNLSWAILLLTLLVVVGDAQVSDPSSIQEWSEILLNFWKRADKIQILGVCPFNLGHMALQEIIQDKLCKILQLPDLILFEASSKLNT